MVRIGSSSVAKEEAQDVVSGLLKNVYRAFDFREEEDVYDKLATSVSGGLPFPSGTGPAMAGAAVRLRDEACDCQPRNAVEFGKSSNSEDSPMIIPINNPSIGDVDRDGKLDFVNAGFGTKYGANTSRS